MRKNKKLPRFPGVCLGEQREQAAAGSDRIKYRLSVFKDSIMCKSGRF